MVEIFVLEGCVTARGVFGKGRQVVSEDIARYLTGENLAMYTSEIKNAPAAPDNAGNRETAANTRRKK